MSLREWLIAIGTLVIIGIIVDGIRRMRRARKESTAISSGMGVDELKDSPLDEHYNPELPSGRARTIPRSEMDQDRAPRTKSRGRPQSPKPTRPVIASGRSQGEQPLSAQAPITDASFPDADEMPGVDRHTDEFSENALGSAEDQWEQNDFPVDDAIDDAADDVSEDTIEIEPPVLKQTPPVAPAPPPKKRVPSQPLAGANRPPAQEVIVINVLARNEEEFKGPALKRLLEACGLQYGDMDIYHRHELSDTISPVQFSVASAVEPGTFKPEEIATLRTPGISFFMSLPGPSNSMQAFNFMYETAQAVVRNLGGELKDERRSVMTSQTAEHCRQRVREFERKQRSKRD